MAPAVGIGRSICQTRPRRSRVSRASQSLVPYESSSLWPLGGVGAEDCLGSRWARASARLGEVVGEVIGGGMGEVMGEVVGEVIGEVIGR